MDVGLPQGLKHGIDDIHPPPLTAFGYGVLSSIMLDIVSQHNRRVAGDRLVMFAAIHQNRAAPCAPVADDHQRLCRRRVSLNLI